MENLTWFSLSWSFIRKRSNMKAAWMSSMYSGTPRTGRPSSSSGGGHGQALQKCDHDPTRIHGENVCRCMKWFGPSLLDSIWGYNDFNDIWPIHDRRHHAPPLDIFNLCIGRMFSRSYIRRLNQLINVKCHALHLRGTTSIFHQQIRAKKESQVFPRQIDTMSFRPSKTQDATTNE